MYGFFKKLAIVAAAGLSLTSAELVKRNPLATDVPTAIAVDQKNDVSDIRYLGYGELIHSGSDTHCTVLMMSNTRGLVAATCVQDAASNYQVAVMGANNGYLNTAKVQAIQQHASFDATTFANNLAILTLDNVYPSGEMRGIIADYPTGWTNRYLVAYSLSSTSPVTPAEPQSVAVPNTNAASCASFSPLFAANPDDYVCMDNTITAPGRASCVTGYNLVVGVTQQNIASGALYSFSVSDSADGLCGTGATVLSYYTVLRNYIPWIASVVGESSIGAMPVTDPGYALTNVPATYAAVPASPAGGGMVAGDGFNLNSGTGEAVNQGVTPKAGQESPAANEPEVQVVSSTVTISITEQVTEFEMISAQTTNTISTTTTETDTTTATIVTTSTETATSTSVVQETVTVTQTQNANGQQASGNGGSNNIAINLDNGQANNNGGVAQTITVTTTATATLSGFTTVTETGVTTVTASVFMSASVAADGATTVVVAVSTMNPPSADTVTVTTVSTELITSVYTVTAVPTGSNGEALAGTVVSTVTETVTANTSGTITEYVGGSASESDPKKSDKQSSSIANAAASEDSDTTVDDSDSRSKLSPGVIAGIVIAILLLLALIGYFIWRRRNKKANETGVTRVEEWMFNHNNKRYSDAPTYTMDAGNY